MVKKFFLLMSLSIGHIQSFFDIEELDRKHAGKLLISPQQVDGLYQLMKDVHDIFTLYNIEYWIQGGTLLGAIRHQGLMWWDDDLDINIDSYHIATIFQLKPVFEKLGYQLLIYHNLMVKIYKDREYWIDIFPTQHHENKTTYVNHWWKRDNKPLYLYDEELYPLKLYQFGPLQVYGPQDPHIYLSCGFGNNYMEHVAIYNHKIPGAFYTCNISDLAHVFLDTPHMSVTLQDRVAALELPATLPYIYF